MCTGTCSRFVIEYDIPFTSMSVAFDIEIVNISLQKEQLLDIPYMSSVNRNPCGSRCRNRRTHHGALVGQERNLRYSQLRLTTRRVRRRRTMGAQGPTTKTCP